MATTATSIEIARVINTTLRNYLKGEEPEVVRRRVLLSMIKSKGRVLYNQSGDGVDWKVRYRRAKMVTNNGQQVISFQAENRWQKAFLDYWGYVTSDAMPKREQLKNRGAAAIIKVYEKLIPLLMEDMEDQFHEELYIDSAVAGNSQRISGLETMFETNGTIQVDAGTQRTANVLDPVGYPSSSYAGISCQLGGVSGSWGEGTAQSGISSTWPSGRGDADYDFWSPVIVNYGYDWTGGSKHDFATNAVLCTRFAIRKMKRNLKKTVPLVMMDDELYRQYLDALDTKERINVPLAPNLAKFGFIDSIYQDGAEITSEYGIPGGVAYGIDLDNVSLLSCQGQLFEADGPEFDMSTRSTRVCVDFIGQMKFASPRNFFKIANLKDS